MAAGPALAAAVLSTACSRAVEEPETSSLGDNAPHVIVISLDTTRADAIGAYAATSHWGLDLPPEARPAPHTPVLDQLAADGVRFSWALAHAPTTLSSHTTVFSGRDPHHHRVVRNGYPTPDDVPLFTERLAAAGWDARAVVGASVLAPSQGISRGFSTWRWPEPDDTQAPGAHTHAWSANSVTTGALAEVDAHLAEAPDQPLLLFAHYYDAHMPWTDAPPGIVARTTDPAYAGPLDGTQPTINALADRVRAGTASVADRRHARGLYLAEVAGVDQQLGRLMAGLQTRGMLDNTLVVVFSDHGETLDESPTLPYSHGPSVALPVLHVPLMMSAYGALSLPSRVVDQTVGLVDVAPTVCGIVGVACDPGQGADLRPLWVVEDPAPRPVRFAEATRPMAQESTSGWNNLPFERAAFGPGPDHGLLLRLQPLLGGQRHLEQISPGAPPVHKPDAATRAAAKALLDGLTAWDAAAPPFRAATYDDDTRAALIALGYLDE